MRAWHRNAKGRKARLIRAVKADRGCARCGFDADVTKLHFHHIEPDKSFTVSDGVYGASIDRLRAEIEKCEVLCDPCHRAEHSVLYSEQRLSEWFDKLAAEAA